MKAKTQKVEDFRIKFVTADGSLIANMHADRDYYAKDGKYHYLIGIEDILKRIGVEKGVRIVSYVINTNDLTATVEWLGRKA